MKQIYIAWTAYQRRAESLRRYAGYELHYVPPIWESKLLKPFSYVAQAARTAVIVLKSAPDVVWFQSPPTFLAHLILILSAVSRKRFKIIADCHNAALRAPWATLPGLRRALSSADLVFVHNGDVVSSLGGLCPPSKVHVLEDPPANLEGGCRTSDEPFVLVPCSFRADEPIPELLAAARRMPEITFIISGSSTRAAARGYLKNVPPNVTFSGFVPIERFDSLLANCAVLVGLTTDPQVQLSVASEGIGAAKAMVLSDTPVLRKMFGGAAVFASNQTDDLVAAIRLAVADQVTLEAKAAASRSQLVGAWRSRMGQILETLG